MNCLIHFFQELDWKDFIYLELNSLLELNNIKPENVYNINERYLNQTPFLKCKLDENIIKNICLRSVLIKSIYEIWAEGENIDECIEIIKNQVTTTNNYEKYQHSSWSFNFDAYRRTFSVDEKREMMRKLNFLPLQGSVNLIDPELSIWTVFYYQRIRDSSSLIPEGDSVENHQLQRVFIGRLVANGGMRDALKKYDLKKRFYIGPTSLDHTLSLIMANIARVKSGSIVLDPFLGTASILVATTHFGALSMGFDIDIRVLKGQMYAGADGHDEKTQQSNDNHNNEQITEPSTILLEEKTENQDETQEVSNKKTKSQKNIEKNNKKKKRGLSVERSIEENFRRYQLPCPQIIRMDLHLFERHCKLSVVENLFDSIVTDPPYGIRAGAKKSGRDGEPLIIPPERREGLIPCTQNYKVEEVMLDLLHMSAIALKLGGYLAYLIPTPYGFTQEDLPKHPCLELVDMCMQGLSTRHSRHLILMRKFRPYTTELRHEFSDYTKQILFDEPNEINLVGFKDLINKLQLALSADGYTNENVVKNSSNAAIRRKESKMKRKKLSESKDNTEIKDGEDRRSENETIDDNQEIN